MDNKKTDLQHSQPSSLQMIPITNDSDLVKAKPILQQIRQVGEQPVKDMIMKSVNKCLHQLSLDASPMFVSVIAEDIMEVYRYDSIEDVTEALKIGRQGKGIWMDEHGNQRGKIYGKLTMELIADWMHIILERKAIAREKQHEAQKSNELSQEDFNEKYIEAMNKPTESQKRFNRAMKAIKESDKIINKHLNR